MSRMKRLLGTFLLAVMLISVFSPAARAEEEADTESYVQQLLGYYLHYQEEARESIDAVLAQMEAQDPQQAQAWRAIMDAWAYTNEEMPIFLEVLPDGLPEDDSLCIVVMGYDLTDNGSMRKELRSRLAVALASAQKYPNAYIAVTGGATSEVSGVTEAGEMAEWLIQNGISRERLIVESRAGSTTENALNVCKILWEEYPQVTGIALVTSDYHVRWSSVLFSAAAEYAFHFEGKPHISMLGNAACATTKTRDVIATQAGGIAEIAGISFNSNIVPELIPVVEETTEPETVPTEAETTAPTPAETEAAEPEEAAAVPVETQALPTEMAEAREEPAQPEKPGLPAVLLGAAALTVLLVLLIPGKKKGAFQSSRSEKRRK